MSLHEYIEKLRARPVRERKRIAVVVTVIGFFVFVGIWLISFQEMNKPAETQIDPTSASLDDLKNNFQDNLQTGKDSIQDMMQDLPNQAGSATTDNNAGSAVQNPVGNLPIPNDNANSSDSLQNPNNILDNNSQKSPDKPSLPQLP